MATKGYRDCPTCDLAYSWYNQRDCPICSRPRLRARVVPRDRRPRESWKPPKLFIGPEVDKEPEVA